MFSLYFFYQVLPGIFEQAKVRILSVSAILRTEKNPNFVQVYESMKHNLHIEYNQVKDARNYNLDKSFAAVIQYFKLLSTESWVER